MGRYPEQEAQCSSSAMKAALRVRSEGCESGREVKGSTVIAAALRSRSGDCESGREVKSSTVIAALRLRFGRKGGVHVIFGGCEAGAVTADSCGQTLLSGGACGYSRDVR